MNWYIDDTWIVITGALSAVSCALLGNFLVLRRMSMMGDAISHAVLPGLAIAFVVTGSRGSVPMFIGAAVVGVLTAVFTQWVHSFGRVDQNASMGVVFTTLFAIGLILIEHSAHHVDLDPGCVLYGAIELTPLDTVRFAGFEAPRAAATLMVVLVLDVIFVIVFYKELKISTFDSTLATTLGINSTVMRYALMAMVAVTTVASFESVGSILVIAMLIVPAAAAYLLTDRLGVMILLSVVVAILCAGIGHTSAITVPKWFGFASTNTAGMMSVAAGLLLFAAMLAGPRHGVVSKLVHRVKLSTSILREDVLGMLYRLEELDASPAARSANLPAHRFREALMGGPLMTLIVLNQLVTNGQLQRVAGGYGLTDQGRDRARNIVRSHRLWETWLAKYLNLPADHVHMPAERLEHITDEQMQRQLEEGIDQTSQDPHGKSIPPPVPPVPPASHA